MKMIILDGSCMTDRAAAYTHIAEKMNFPSYFGKNLDALWDMLTTCRDTDVSLFHASVLLNNLGSYGCKLIACFFDAAKENPYLHFRIEEFGI